MSFCSILILTLNVNCEAGLVDQSDVIKVLLSSLKKAGPVRPKKKERRKRRKRKRREGRRRKNDGVERRRKREEEVPGS